MTGTMRIGIHLLGTSLRLNEGQRVRLTRATNQPGLARAGYYAAPLDGEWSDGVNRPPEDSILITPDDVTLGEPV